MGFFIFMWPIHGIKVSLKLPLTQMVKDFRSVDKKQKISHSSIASSRS